MKLWQLHNISDAEYTCHCCGTYPAELDGEWVSGVYSKLFEAFSDIREEWGEPIVVSSGFRCARHNALVGGVPLSAHLFGVALDLRTGSIEKSREMRGLARSINKDLRIGVYPTFIHIDVAYMINPKVLGEWRKGASWNV